MKRIAVLTSGGDAPGMNAAIRAVVRGGEVKTLENLVSFVETKEKRIWLKYESP